MLSWNINLSQIVPLDDGNTDDILRCILYFKFKFFNEKIPGLLFVPHDNVIFRGVASQVPRELHAPNRNNEKYGGSENWCKDFLRCF